MRVVIFRSSRPAVPGLINHCVVQALPSGSVAGPTNASDTGGHFLQLINCMLTARWSYRRWFTGADFCVWYLITHPAVTGMGWWGLYIVQEGFLSSHTRVAILRSTLGTTCEHLWHSGHSRIRTQAASCRNCESDAITTAAQMHTFSEGV